MSFYIHTKFTYTPGQLLQYLVISNLLLAAFYKLVNSISILNPDNRYWIAIPWLHIYAVIIGRWSWPAKLSHERGFKKRKLRLPSTSVLEYHPQDRIVDSSTLRLLAACCLLLAAGCWLDSGQIQTIIRFRYLDRMKAHQCTYSQVRNI